MRIPTCTELIDRIVADAETVMAEPLAGRSAFASRRGLSGKTATGCICGRHPHVHRDRHHCCPHEGQSFSRSSIIRTTRSPTPGQDLFVGSLISLPLGSCGLWHSRRGSVR